VKAKEKFEKDAPEDSGQQGKLLTGCSPELKGNRLGMECYSYSRVQT